MWEFRDKSFHLNITQLCNNSVQCTVYTNALVTFIKGFSEGQFALLPLDQKI